MSLIDQLVNWLRGSSAAAQPRTAASATIGDRLLLFAADYLKAKATQAQDKANAANAAAPADNAPGATQRASEAPIGQRLCDLLKSCQQ